MSDTITEPKPIFEKRTYSVPEVAKILDISRTLAYDMVREKRIPSITLGKNRKIVPIDAFNKWLMDAVPMGEQPVKISGEN